MAFSFSFEDLTQKEKEAIKQIDKAMKVLSKRHWFYGNASGLDIIRYGSDNERVINGATFSPDMVAGQISGYDIDGGDW